MMYRIKALSGKTVKLSKKTDRQTAIEVAEQMFFFGDYNYVCVENIDGMIIAEWEI